MAGEFGDRDRSEDPHIAAGNDAYVAGGNMVFNKYVYADPPDAVRMPGAAQALAFLKELAEGFRWLDLQDIRASGSLRVELEKVYVALKALPETDYDLRHLANLHTIEVREAVGGAALDLIEPARLAALDEENVRRTYRPLREEARQSSITEVQTIADAFRQYNRIVLLGGPGSGKTTLGRWLALQLAQGMLRQAAFEVTAEPESDLSNSIRVNVAAGTASTFSRGHFTPSSMRSGRADTTQAIRIDELPARGTLTLSGEPVDSGRIIPVDQIERLTYTPADSECASPYAHVRYTAISAAPPEADGAAGLSTAGVVTIDVGVHVYVPLAQIDPEPVDGQDPAQLVDLGPARFPIFLRLAHFAQELARRKGRDEPTLSLAEYLGLDPDSASRADGCTPQTRNTLLNGFLKRDSAVVILDGLDELSETNRRTVLRKIQDFIEKKESTEKKNIRLNAPGTVDAPWRAGGNQVVITSRYVGYKLLPVRSGCAHFGIQAMRRPAVERFARAWFRAVTEDLGDEASGASWAEALIAEIYDASRPAIRELATNPLLVTILAMVYWVDGHLPDQRAAVYDRVVENLLELWLNRPECRKVELTREELLAALEPLAADMQENRDYSLIGLGRIAELVAAPLAHMRTTTPADRAFRPVLETLLRTIGNHVGLLAEQSPGNYAFFHRTFQEFLAARHLLSSGPRAAAEIVARLDDPVWREPLLLAVGLMMASPEWGGPETRARLLEDVLAADEADPLIPHGAMLLVSALPGLEQVTMRVIGKIVEQLLGSYAFSQQQPQAERMREAIRGVFARLRDGARADLVAEAIGEAIGHSGGVRNQPAERHFAGAAADLLSQLDWFTTGMVEALLQAAPQDSARLGWPVHWALLAALGQSSADRTRPRERSTPKVNTRRLVLAHLPMRRLLESNPELTGFVRGDIDWLWLIIALCGGLDRASVRESLQARQPAQPAGLRSADEGDTADESNATHPPREPIPSGRPIDFSPGDIVQDLADGELRRAVMGALRLRRPAAELAAVFLRVWRRGTDPICCAEAVLGLAALGEDVIPLVREALADPARRPVARATLERFGRLRTLLREPLLRASETAARTLPDEAPEDRQLDLLRIVIEARVAAGGDPLAVSDAIASLRFVDATSDRVRDAVDAEGWAYLFSGHASQASDVMGELHRLPAPTDRSSDARALSGWPALPQARNHRARLRLPWPQPFLAPRLETPVERYLTMLDALLDSPPEYEYRAGLLLGRARSTVAEHPELIWETLAVCCFRGRNFVAGYLAGATGGDIPSSACASVAADFVGLWVQRYPVQRNGEALREAFTAALLGFFDAETAANQDPNEADAAFRAQADRIADPYLRFRAQWSLIDEIGLTRPVDADVVDPLEQITDRHDLARAVEMTMIGLSEAWLGLKARRFLDHELMSPLFMGIEDPDDRARALCRLTLLAPERPEILLDAAESIRQIADPGRRAETISEIRTALGGSPSLERVFDALAAEFPEQWLTDKARGRASRLIAAYRGGFTSGALAWRLPASHTGHGRVGAAVHRLAYPTGRLAWGLLYLDSTADEIGALTNSAARELADWDLLSGPEWQTGVQALIETADGGGLRITTQEASVLNRLVQSGRTDVLDGLWGHLESPDTRSTAIATRWSAAAPAAERWKALLHVEAGLLTPNDVDLVVELVTGATDRLRLRAQRALHGTTPHNRNRNRRWSVSRVGAQSVEALARHGSRTDYAPAVCSSLNWVRNDIHHDDAEALRHWLSEAAESPDSPAHWILKSMESIEGGLATLLPDYLPTAPANLQQTLLNGLSRLYHLDQIPSKSHGALWSAVAAVPSEVRRKLRFLPEGAVECLNVAAQAAACPDDEARLDLARALINERTLWLDDACISDETTLLKRLELLGDSHYTDLGPRGYWKKTNDAAAKLAEDEGALRLMLAWVETLSLTDDVTGLTRHLLTAADALAQASPNAFTALADPDTLEPILTEWAVAGDHWTARLAAVRMLGLLRRVSKRVAAALRAAVSDVSFVQQAAYDCVEHFRSMKEDLTPEFLGLLDDADTGVAASATRLLVNLAQGEGSTADRRRILRAFQDSASRLTLPRDVYLMSDVNSMMSIQHVDRLDRILYRAIFEVSGL